jgi:hypothetical protein
MRRGTGNWRPMDEMYCSENPKLISRTSLERLRQKLLEPLRTNPPTIGSYSRDMDVELFRLFSVGNVALVRREKMVTLGGCEVRPKREVWVYETHGTTVTMKDEGIIHDEYVEFGEVQKGVTFLPIPKLAEVPRYTENTDDALFLKERVLCFKRRVLLEEVEDEHISRWRAKIIGDNSSQTWAKEKLTAAGVPSS